MADIRPSGDLMRVSVAPAGGSPPPAPAARLTPHDDGHHLAATPDVVPDSGPGFQPVKVVDVEIDSALPDLDGLDRYGFVQLLVRLHGSPLGWVRLPVHEGRCSAASIRERILRDLIRPAAYHLLDDFLAENQSGVRSSATELLGVAHPGPEGALPSVTVAVCTRDRSDVLARCLESIERVEYPDLDVVVVDNAPCDDRTMRMVAERFAAFRYVREPRPGLDWARNRAISESPNDVVVFTDDDVVVDPLWVRSIARVFGESDDVMAVTGLVVPFELETSAQALFEQYGGFGRGFVRQWYTADSSDGARRPLHVGAGRFGTGANMAFRRRIFEEIGHFDPALDVGTETHGGGDLEMFFRVLEEGHTLVYEPSAVVRHRHRRDYAALRTQIENNGVGFYSFLVRSALAYPRRASMLFRWGMWWLWRWSLRRLVISFVRPGRFPRDLILAELKGSIVGMSRYPRARRRAAAIARDHERMAVSNAAPRQ